MGATGFAFFLAIGAIGAAFLLGPMGRAIAKRIGGREAGAPDDDATARFQELEHRMAEVEQANARIAELEERVDFTERLLSQDRETPRLDRGAS